jgi:Dolichyl-phosphate-mannose-protein mannosyltransferase
MHLAFRLWPGGLIALAAAIRLALIAFGWPVLNSDEATMGLMASHIAYHAEHPAFLYGQSYMGALEAYLGAAIFRLLGSSAFALRLGAVLLYSLFLTSIYGLARRLYDFKVALIALLLLVAGSEQMLYQQIQAVGRLETLVFGAVSLLLAFMLADSAHSNSGDSPNKRRLAGYAAWGLLAGLGIWSDVEVIPFLLTSALLLLVFCQRNFLGRPLLFLLTGVLIGASPLIAYDLTSSPERSAVAVLSQIYRSGGTGRLTIHSSPSEGLAGAFLVTLPTMTGANAVCSVDAANAWPLSSKTASHTVGCTVLHGFWSGGIILLWMTSAYLSLRKLVVLKGNNRFRRPTCDLRLATRDSAQLALLLAAALIFLLYALSPASSQVPWYSRRYLTPLWVSLPAIVYPLALLTGTRFGRFAVLRRVAAFGSLAAISLVLLLGTGEIFATMSDLQWWNNRQNALVNDLLRIRATRIYSDYWSCNRIIFQSHERVICSVLDKHLKPGENRYLHYTHVVQSAPHPLYVFPAAAPENAFLVHQLSKSHLKYRRLFFDGYIIYQPAGTPLL